MLLIYFESFTINHFFSVFRVNPSVCKNGDYYGGETADYYHPEEVGVADCFLNYPANIPGIIMLNAMNAVQMA